MPDLPNLSCDNSILSAVVTFIQLRIDVPSSEVNFSSSNCTDWAGVDSPLESSFAVLNSVLRTIFTNGVCGNSRVSSRWVWLALCKFNESNCWTLTANSACGVHFPLSRVDSSKMTSGSVTVSWLVSVEGNDSEGVVIFRAFVKRTSVLNSWFGFQSFIAG